ncbi:MAG: hypothetical protein ABWY78_12520, partial [Microvirga sp.]
EARRRGTRRGDPRGNNRAPATVDPDPPAGEPIMLPVHPGLSTAHGTWLPGEPGPFLKAAGIVPLGDGGDAGAVPPGTERVENAMGVIGIGLALLLAVCAILIAVRGRKR